MVERYADDLRADGAKAFFFQGGTTTPLTVFRDSGESSAHPNPVLADANGRWPDVFVPYTIAFDVQVKSKDDVQLTFSLLIPNPNPVDLTVVVPPESTVQTGMIHAEMLNTTKPGFVRLNGRTIGNGSSPSSERANNDTSALFSYLWNNLTDTIAPVSGGRGGSASSDFAANKTIVLPSLQGMSLLGLDDMGNTAANAFAGLTFNAGSATVAGSWIGTNSVTLSSTQMPSHFHTGTTGTETYTGGSLHHTHSFSGSQSVANHQHNVFVKDSGHTHTYNDTGIFAGATLTQTTNTAQAADSQRTTNLGFAAVRAASDGVNVDDLSALAGGHTVTIGGTTGNESLPHTHTFTTSTEGGVTPINNIPYARLVTWFIKL